MDREKVVRKYRLHKLGAALRGIQWQFTLESWLAWWGDDLDKRGRGADDLCMMRVGDVGPYSPSNTRKGTNRQNAKTRGVTTRTKRTLAAYRALQEEIERTPAKVDDPLDEITEEEEWLRDNLGFGNTKISLYEPKY